MLHLRLLNIEDLGSTGPTFPVVNPATGELLARVPAMGREETIAAIEVAENALRSTPAPAQRQQWLHDIERALLENREELATIITQEQGKPLSESRVEVEYSAGFFRFFAHAVGHLSPQAIEETIRDARWTTHHRPAGVVALITPWNFPLAMLAKKLAPAIAAGCTAVIKPAKLTPLSAIALRALALQAGVPAERVHVITGEAGPIGDVLCSHPAVRLVSFTGSTEVGRRLIATTAPHIKRLALELGGNAPYIVFEDADIEAAAAAVVPNKFRCAGQTCVCANRFYVHCDVLDAFTQLVCEHIAKLRVGNGMDDNVNIGPLMNRAAWNKVALHVDDALQKGATRVLGATPTPSAHDWGNFFPPTVLTGITPAMLLTREETFGPVVGISAFESEEEAISLANSTSYGLAAYVFSTDAARLERVIPRLAFGHVGVNSGTGPTPEAPFGGMKQSGFGREGGLEGLFEYCEPQTVAQAVN